MSTQARIEQKLFEGLDPVHLDVLNESNKHNVPPGSESHFKITVASPRFEGLRLPARHRQVYGLLAEELSGGVHALALHTLTPEEWAARGGRVAESPPCRGGGKRRRSPP
ncbi:BolA family protein [Ectothiorhodospira lacustris]|uniref:BolA family protein n=1 Tax=Ectothiorhodospira lacustris TaxID=2899127 RepID=UPI001EE81E2A|nr:BolA/IbaG family iron-sulfur metabolism protein [Ectothiorhodospira lacustris]MCG5501975.1 BolA/IbaG family iron-sulfur metabolism protein [Ectothiorhodospira lacustris]